MISSTWRLGFGKWLVMVNAVLLLAIGLHGARAERQDDPPKPGDAELLRHELAALGKVRVDAAQQTFELLFKPFRTGIGTRPEPERAYHWSRRWVEAELDNCAGKPDRIGPYERHLTRMKELRDDVKAAKSSGRVTPAQESAVDYYWSEAAFWLARAKADR